MVKKELGMKVYASHVTLNDCSVLYVITTNQYNFPTTINFSRAY